MFQRGDVVVTKGRDVYRDVDPKKEYVVINMSSGGGYHTVGAVDLGCGEKNAKIYTIYFKGVSREEVVVRTMEEGEFRDFVLSRGVVLKNTPYLLVGADPEVFLFSKGKVVPSWKVLPKKNAGQGVFWDGLQGEFTIDEPTYCHELFMDQVHYKLEKIVQRGKMYGYGDIGFDPKTTVVEMGEEILAEAAEEHLALGCMPSKNVYGLPGCEKVEGRDLKWRFSGCHLHYGTGVLGVEGQREVIKTMDAITGVMITSMFEGYEDSIRRRYYGKAGEYRTPKHGIEWRVPSSVIMQHPGLMMLVMDVNRLACRIGLWGGRERFWDVSEEETIGVIMEYDFKLARKVLKRNVKGLERLLEICYSGGKITDKRTISKALEVILLGVEKVCPQVMENAMENWYIGKSWNGCAGNTGCKWSSLAQNI